MNHKRLPVNLSKWTLSLMLLAALTVGNNIKAQESNRRILFLSDHEGSIALYTMQADGTDIQRWSLPLFEEGGTITSASLSPDGTTLAVSSRKERSPDDFTDEIFLLELATGAITMLTNDGRNNTLPSWSPDSQHLAYLTGLGVNGFGTVHIADLVSHDLQVLMTETSLAPVVHEDIGAVIRWLDWSPDGNQLVLSVQTGLPDVFNMLIVVNADGTDARQVTPNEMSVGPVVSWGADPNSIYTACHINDYGEICQLSLQTLQIAQLSNMTTAFPDADNPFVSSLDVSPEGEVIFSYGVTDPSIYQFNVADGSVILIRSVTSDNFELLGSVDMPPVTACATADSANHQTGE
jgi:Tol biopolymer transport system component